VTGGRGVVVTGVGMITTLGATAVETAAAWRRGDGPRLEEIPELTAAQAPSRRVAALPTLDPGERLGGRRMLKYMSGAAVLGCIAAREATSAARVRDRFRPERVGLYAGTGLAAASVNDVLPLVRNSLDGEGVFSCRLLGGQGLPQTNPLLSFHLLPNMPPCLVSLLEAVRGPSLLYTPWEGQAAAALLDAWEAVASGEVDCALAGAADTPAHPATFLYLQQSGRLTTGEFPGSGAAYVVLEPEDRRDPTAPKPLARIQRLSLTPTPGPVDDPLASRMGRTFAAAPAIVLGLACLGIWSEVSLQGSDGECFRVQLEAAA